MKTESKREEKAYTKERANVLVIGNSGAGKSTLINSILGDKRAEAKSGEAVTQRLAIYENIHLPFRLIDTIGFEFDIIKQWKAINAVKRWSRDSITKDSPERQIDLIWYCVEATSKKLFEKNINMLSQAVSTWKNAPVVVVLTKSYSSAEDDENIEMIYEGFNNCKRRVNLKAVIPVVAQAYKINDDVTVEPHGLTELIETTNSLMPEGIRLSKEAVFDFKLRQKRYEANALIGAAVVSGGTAVAVNVIPWTDTAVLSTLEMGMITGVAKIYGVTKKAKGDAATAVISKLVEIGSVSTVAKGIVEIVKTFNPVAKIANVLVACTVILAIGEITVSVMENIYTGKVEVQDIDWIKKFAENEWSKTTSGKAKKIIEKIAKDKNVNIRDIPRLIAEMFH